MDELMEKCENLLENIQRQEILNSSTEILDNVREKHPEFYEKELYYQQYRNQFSKAYFSGSEWYVGDSYTSWFLSRPWNVEDKKTFIFYSLLSAIINSINKNTTNL